MSTTDRKLSRLVSLDSIVYDVLNDIGDYDKTNFIRYKQWALRGLQSLRLHILNIMESDYFTVDSNNIINLPDDFIDYIRVGYINEGRIYTLSLNESIPITNTIVNGATAQYDAIKDSEPIPEIGTWLSAPPKIWNIAFFRYDKEANRMIFSGDMAGQSILIEYVSTGVSRNGTCFLPVQARESLIAWVHWQRAMGDVKATLNDKREKERIFKGTVSDLVNFEFSFTIDDIVDVISEGYSQLVKR